MSAALSPEQLAELEDLLEAELAKLLRSMDISEEAAKTVELDQAAVGRLSRMDSLQNQAMAQGLRERESARLAALTGALRRLEVGAYGVCEGCGQDIAYGRLLVFPEAVTCPGCGS